MGWPGEMAPLAMTLPASHARIGIVLIEIAGYLHESRESIARMAASSDPQDVHNSRIHHGQLLVAEVCASCNTEAFVQSLQAIP